MATKNYQWAAAVTVESGGYQGELISIEQNGVEVFSGSVNISQIPKTFNLPWTTTTDETGSSTYTYTYRDSDTMNNNNSTRVSITVTDEWAVSISKNNVMTVTVHTVMNSAVRTRIGSPSNVNRHIWMRRKSNGNDFNPFPLIDNASTAHTIASNVDMGNYIFSLQPGEDAQNATVWWRSTNVGHEGDRIPNIYTDILRVGIHFKNILPKDYVPGKIWNDTSTVVETKTGTNITFDDTVHAPLEDLKVGGNIEQTTYSGKNLFDGELEDGGYSQSDGSKVSSTSQARSVNAVYVNPNTTYTLSVSGVVYANLIRWFYYTANGTYISTETSSTGQFTTPSNCYQVRFHSSKIFQDYAPDYNVNMQVELGLTATSFEPYVGGIPSPNPDYPQNVNVATGIQTVTISNGQGQNQNFTIGLGSIELRKIGNYQDYIHQVNGEWYIHKVISTKTYVGASSEGWSYFQYGGYSLWRSYDIPTGMDTSAITSDSFKSNNFTYWVNDGTSVSVGVTNGHFGFPAAANNINFKYTAVEPALNDWTTWLANHPTTVYYPLATPTETKITNITFISQLNAIKSFGTYSGDTIIAVSGNISSPLTVSAKVFSDQGAWLSHNRTNGTAEIYNGLTWPQMRTYDGGVGTGNPPTIEHSDEVWRNQRLIGDE